VAGLLRPDSGRIAVGETVFFDSQRGVDLPVHRRELGVVFQDARLFPHLDVRDNLLYGWRRAGGRTRSPVATLDSVVPLLGLESLLDRKPHTLSGGERQRVAFGRALLAQPSLLLMDEPLASLDAARKAELLPCIERLGDEFGLPILYVSHSIDEVLRLATSLVLFDQGRVSAAGPLAEVLEHPAAAALSEAGALVFGRVQRAGAGEALTPVACDGFTLRVPALDLPEGASVRVRIPAREVALSLQDLEQISISNRIEGVIERIDAPTHPQGPARVRVRVGSETVLAAAITTDSVRRLALVPGLRCWCLVKAVALDRAALAPARGRAAHSISAAPSSRDPGAPASR
jgi:molybdate transport system ATP-binding protein